MTLFDRIRHRGRRVVRSLADLPLRRRLQAQLRPPRTLASIADLRGRSALIIVAHPDDEVIAAGALLGHLAKAQVICVTDGAPRHGGDAKMAGFDNWLDYAKARRREAEAALARIGRDLPPTDYLGIADQDAVLHLEAVARYLVGPLKSGFDYVITHPYEGGHPDHDAVAFAVHAACALIARSGGRPPVILEAPFYNSASGKAETGGFIAHPDAGEARIMPLQPGEQALKRSLYDCHVTQQYILRDFKVEQESFRVAPRYHFTVPPHAGEMGYSRFSWALKAAHWRGHAWGAIRRLGLGEELA